MAAVGGPVAEVFVLASVTAVPVVLESEGGAVVFPEAL